METRRLRVPLDPCLTGHIRIALFVAKYDSASGRTKAGPDMRNTALVIDRHVVLSGVVDLYFQVWIGHARLGHGSCCRVFPAFFKEQRNWCRRTSRGGRSGRRRLLSESAG